MIMMAFLLRFLLVNVIKSFLFRFSHPILDGDRHLFFGVKERVVLLICRLSLQAS